MRRRGGTDPAGGLAALRDRGYLVLAVGFALVTVAEWAFTTALAIRAYELGGALAVGLAGARFLPAAVAAVPIGSLGDRFPPGWVMAGSAALQAAMIGCAALAVVEDASFGVLLALAVADAIVATAYRPAQARLIPALARTPPDVSAAAGLLTTTKTICQVLGALLAGLLLETAGLTAAFAVPAATLLVAALVAGGMAGRLHTRAASPPVRGREAADWLAGVRTLVERTEVAHVAGLSALRSLGRGLWLALATVAALGFLGLGSGGVGLLMALSGVGVLVSLPITALLIGRPAMRGPLLAALALCGIPLMVIAIVGRSGVALAGVVVWGLGMALADAILTALQFRVVDAPVLSRTVGAIESLKIAAEGAGALVAPLLVAMTDVRAAIGIAGAIPVIVAVADALPLAAVDRVAARRVARVQLLRGVPLFATLGMEPLERLAAGAESEIHPVGADIVREGDMRADLFYVIEGGTADVLLGEWAVAHLGPGDAFGERALLRDAPRAATVRATSELALQAIQRDDFLAALTGTDREVRLERPREGDPQLLIATLRALPLLTGLDDAGLHRLAATGTLRSVTAGEAIVREGEAGDELFVILTGEARVEKEGRTLTELLPGDHFGEIALLHDVPRTATVRARTDGLLLAIGRDAYRAATAVQGGAGALEDHPALGA